MENCYNEMALLNSAKAVYYLKGSLSMIDVYLMLSSRKESSIKLFLLMERYKDKDSLEGKIIKSICD